MRFVGATAEYEHRSSNQRSELAIVVMNKLHRSSVAQPSSISIVAHRGKTATIKSENTIEAFKKAIEIGIPQIEFDLRMSQDGYIVSYHDRTIVRNTPTQDEIEIADLKYHELQSIARSQGFEVPLFEDILKLCRNRVALDIEIKEEGYEDRIVELATQYLDYSNFVIKSFNDDSVRRIKDLDPQIVVGLLLGKIRGKFPLMSILAQFFPEYRIFKTGADFVAPHFRLLKFGFLWRMKLLNCSVYVWTVNEERRLFKLIRTKDIAAIITDKPELAMKMLDTLHQQRLGKGAAAPLVRHDYLRKDTSTIES
ncbi:glycerophosphodiester phosphodiesterase [Chamaesiphon polymorphus CCALA 037]|uniref:Glycerophosphodiester phosphodiesterase n=2 Tax=Chamaesiphon TaxID=217161 RepID=A0A2T1F9M6_9CYAN|nr:glycerophosphodiester phosphodiesterase [Chamaesiphon polymorphus CCALA 037]